MAFAVSLFSNCGAGDVGYRKAGFTFAVMAELEEKRLKVCLLNHKGAKGVPGDLRLKWKEVVKKWWAKRPAARPDLLCACPPCQGMSSARAGMGNGKDPANGGRDARNLLVEVVANVIKELRPRIVVLENVPQFLTRIVPHPDRDEKDTVGITAPRLLQERVGKDYQFFPVLLDLADYGVPQTRKRSFITLVSRDEPWLAELERLKLTPYPVPTHETNRVTFEACFNALAKKLPSLDPRTKEGARWADDVLHAVPVWNGSENDRRYQMTEATALDGGSAWNNTTCVAGCRNQDVDAEAALCPQCGQPLLRPVVWDEKNEKWRLIKGFRSSSYRRMNSQSVAATITTASGHIGSDVNLHPKEHRLLSVRECAILQTFPDDFKWGDAPTKWGLGQVREMIGEAVPPHFTAQHGKVLKDLLDGKADFAGLLSVQDVRNRRAEAKFNGVVSQFELELVTAPTSGVDPGTDAPSRDS